MKLHSRIGLLVRVAALLTIYVHTDVRVTDDHGQL